MGCAANCPCTPDQVDLAFRESEQFIDRQVADRSYRMKRWLLDYAPVRIFPDGIGFEMSKVRFFGDIGPQYDGFEGWRKDQRSRPAAGACGPQHDACGYVWEEVGHGFEELHWSLMRRDLRTVPICVEDIRTFWEFQQFQNMIFQNLTEISANMREQLNRNALIGFSVKHVITSKGLEVNSANPYELPNIQGVTLGKLNWRVLKRLYNPYVREAGSWAIDTIDGRPVFGVVASDEVLDDVTYEDPEIRQDMRQAFQGQGASSPLLSRYNFLDSWRGLFIPIPDNSAPRYKADSSGNLYRVFPFERDIQIQNGVRPSPNPDYENAPYELVLIITKDIFALRSKKAITTVGGQTDFNAETSMFDWKWHNPDRWCDPNRRKGYYYANGHLGVEPGDFTDIVAILVQRRPSNLDATYWPQPTCPPDPVVCTNVLAAQGCPTLQVVGCCADITNSHRLQMRFSGVLPTTTPPFNLTLDLSTGDTKVVSVISVSSDGCAAVVDFGAVADCCPDLYLQVHAVNSSSCSTPVLTDSCDSTGLVRTVTVAHQLKAFSNGSVISSLGSDGTYRDVTITTGASALSYVATLGSALPDGVCLRGLCIPTGIDATCPACGPQTIACDLTTGLP